MKAPILVPVVLRNLFKKPATNRFPQTEPVPIPEDFRGMIAYNVDKCVGCRMCVNVCPAGVFVYLPEIRKVALWTARCVYCGQCVDVCPTGALQLSKDFLLASYDNHDDRFIPLKPEKVEEIKRKLEEQKKAKEAAKKEKEGKA
ncbi:membrane bound hydrogenase, 4Fe-4S cluster-binding subunit [Thermococcus kodakarensis KOD1]|uniref:Membrane bound hydrogenase, 4Fe-4S cluster-binding subunit n=1 Tax=Thermococcus kodakarensis (strain ATCC BAA-918 / JCM 12380 / KOD1) TaxID=69014 RepID=Q5JIL1_THEKO|nr:4Fe-4S binding protein [Thermococcus kodakarensis]WCN27948.1 4Fe-4S dicluster domain-containing protein [Thermococcus kodakarensis]WCN30247.1 4Fe-4S dicluster domain-containing protein [Thermococcus kodakarensis]BAD86282.1 membrane bound hydrogenase, 4Fe-4S cluster-binding subunit [Thermococcus kodakarensis KOD1]